jgi:hypothetical protein
MPPSAWWPGNLACPLTSDDEREGFDIALHGEQVF